MVMVSSAMKSVGPIKQNSNENDISEIQIIESVHEDGDLNQADEVMEVKNKPIVKAQPVKNARARQNHDEVFELESLDGEVQDVENNHTSVQKPNDYDEV